MRYDSYMKSVDATVVSLSSSSDHTLSYKISGCGVKDANFFTQEDPKWIFGFGSLPFRRGPFGTAPERESKRALSPAVQEETLPSRMVTMAVIGVI